MDTFWCTWLLGALGGFGMWMLIRLPPRQWLNRPVLGLLWTVLGSVAAQAWSDHISTNPFWGQLMALAAAIVYTWMIGVLLDAWRTGLVWSTAASTGGGFVPLPVVAVVVTAVLLALGQRPLVEWVLWPLVSAAVVTSLMRFGIALAVDRRASSRTLSPSMIAELCARPSVDGDPVQASPRNGKPKSSVPVAPPRR